MGCTNCPCSHNAVPGTVGGCINSAARSARLFLMGSDSLVAADLAFRMEDGNSMSSTRLVSGANALPNQGPCPSGSGIQPLTMDGLRCVGNGILRHGSRTINALGEVGTTTNGWGGPAPPAGGLIAFAGVVAIAWRFRACWGRPVFATLVWFAVAIAPTLGFLGFGHLRF